MDLSIITDDLLRLILAGLSSLWRSRCCTVSKLWAKELRQITNSADYSENIMYDIIWHGDIHYYLMHRLWETVNQSPRVYDVVRYTTLVEGNLEIFKTIMKNTKYKGYEMRWLLLETIEWGSIESMRYMLTLMMPRDQYLYESLYTCRGRLDMLELLLAASGSTNLHSSISTYAIGGSESLATLLEVEKLMASYPKDWRSILICYKASGLKPSDEIINYINSKIAS